MLTANPFAIVVNNNKGKHAIYLMIRVGELRSGRYFGKRVNNFTSGKLSNLSHAYGGINYIQ